MKIILSLLHRHMHVHPGLHHPPHHVREPKEGCEEILLVDGYTVVLNIVIFGVSATNLAQTGADTGMKEPNLDCGLPGGTSTWLEVLERIYDIKYELGGLQDANLGLLPREVASRVEDLGDLGDHKPTGQGEVEEGMRDKEAIPPM